MYFWSTYLVVSFHQTPNCTFGWLFDLFIWVLSSLKCVCKIGSMHQTVYMFMHLISTWILLLYNYVLAGVHKHSQSPSLNLSRVGLFVVQKLKTQHKPNKKTVPCLVFDSLNLSSYVYCRCIYNIQSVRCVTKLCKVN